MSIEEFGEMEETTQNFSQPGGHVGSGPVPHDHIYEDVKAAAAVAGIPPSEIADKCEFLEGRLAEWLATDFTVETYGDGMVSRFVKVKIPRSYLIALTTEPLRILRLEVRELALALSTEMVEKKTAENRAGIYSEYVRLRGQLSDLHDFLKQHCDMELQRGQAQNLSLFDIVKTVILKDR